MYAESFTTDFSAKLDLQKPTLEGLSFLLRHKELWPEGFQWYYPNPACCAIGLTYKFWKKEQYGMTEIFNISPSVSDRIFVEAPFYHRCFGIFPRFDVSPEMVADDIDKYLKKSKK
jgi:hypothetical protein